MQPCWPRAPAVPSLSPTGVQDSPLPTTRSCFVRVSHSREKDFQQSCPSPQVTSAQNPLYVLPQDGWRHRLLTPATTGGASSPGFRSAETPAFKEPSQIAGTRRFWNSGLHVAALRKRPGLPSMNQIIPRCVHMGWATLLPTPKAEGWGAA